MTNDRLTSPFTLFLLGCWIQILTRLMDDFAYEPIYLDILRE